MAAIGDNIGNYKITGIIGRGAMATVFRAHDERLNRNVALKLLESGYSSDLVYRARFEREYRITALLKNEHIVPIYDGGSWGDQLYIAMMPVEGPNLSETMHNDGPMSLRRVVAIVDQLAEALDDAHSQRVIHRDVKPANVLIANHGPNDPEHVYLADFGLTLGMEGTHLTRTGGFMGTLAYAAPEQLNSAPIDGRADEYALAATTFQMLTGEMPFRRDNEMALINAQLFDPPPKVTDLRPELPPRVDDVIARGMAKRPEDRYRTAGEFAAALSAAQSRFAAAPTVMGSAAAAAAGAAGGPQSRSRVAALAVALGIVAAAILGAAVTFALLSGGGPGGSGDPGATPSAPPGSLPAVAVGSSTPSSAFTPDASTDLPTLSPSDSPGAPTSSSTPTPTRTPRSTPKGPPPTGPPPTQTPTQAPPTTPPTTPPTLPPSLPQVASGSWSVANSPRSVSGSPHVLIGAHGRRYVITSNCGSADSCRLAAITFDSSTGNRLGSIVLKWDGTSFVYNGPADWYRRAGGASCETSTGDVIANAYTTHEQVRVQPQTLGGQITHMTGTKTLSGTPTAVGEAAGCAPFTMSFDVDMNSTG